MLTILFDGIAYGMLLFVLACGLSVTLGLMNFINLAHGAFAMVGGYVTALLMNRAGVPFLATLPLAFLVPAIVGVALERTLYRRLYGASPLDQVLFTIGLVFMAMPIANYFLGDQPQQVHLPALSCRAASSSAASASASIGCSSSSSAARSPRCCRSSSSARASARNCARRSTTRASPTGSASTSIAVRRHFRGRQRACGPRRRARRRCGRRHRSDLSGQIHGLLPDRRHRSAARTASSARCSARCCSACSTSPANITFPRSAPSSSTP